MGLELPENATEVEQRAKTDVQRALPSSNPFLFVSWLGALITGYANRIYDFYLHLRNAELEAMPDTAVINLPRWAAIWLVTRLPATAAGVDGNSNIVATGADGSVIPAGTAYAASDGKTYSSLALATITAQALTIDVLSSVGAVATATINEGHGLASNVPVTIAGATPETEYNGLVTITVISATQFTYPVSGSPGSPAGGVITASFTAVPVPVSSDEEGEDQNQLLDAVLALQSPIAGVDDNANVDANELGGGTDQETISAFRARYLERVQKPIAHFNAAEIESTSKTVPGVTRVFVNEAGDLTGSTTLSGITRTLQVATATSASPHGFVDGQTATITGADQAEYNVTDTQIIVESTTIFHYVVSGSPAVTATTSSSFEAEAEVAPGTVDIYFMRDNDTDPIPSGSEVADVQEALEAIRPANTSASDVNVMSPTAVPTAFTFTDLQPATATMQSAVLASLRQFFDERTAVGVNVDKNAYEAAIYNTLDVATGQEISTFTLATPTTDIDIEYGEIGTLGTVTFP